MTIAGVAIGVAAMIVVLSIINGFETELRNRFLAANAHILAYKIPEGIDNYQDIMQKINSEFKDKNVLSGVSPFIHTETMVKKNNTMVATLVRGIDPELRNKVQPQLAKYITPAESIKKISDNQVSSLAKLNSQNVIIGIGLSKRLQAEIGDQIKFVTPQREGLFGIFKDYKVVGIYDSGFSHYDDKLAIMSIKAAQRLDDEKSVVTGVEIGLIDPWQAEEFEYKLETMFLDMIVKNWQDFNLEMFQAIQYERVLISLLVALVALVGGFNILTTLYISVFQKERDISLLRAIGSNKLQILVLFIKQGLLMGLVGCSVGLLLAFFLATALEKYQIVSLPDVYMLARLPVEYNPKVYLVTWLVGMIIIIIAGIIPARSASKQDLTSSLKHRIG